MKKILLLLAFAILLHSCKRTEVHPADVISQLTISNREPYADGTTWIDISATLNDKADSDKTGIVFSATAGQFAVANDTVITQKAVYQAGHLTANVRLKMPATAAKIIIKAKPASASPYFDFILRDSLIAKKAVPDRLVLTPSAVSVHTAFNGEITLSAQLSFQGKNVSTGNKVRFEDYLPGGAPVAGTFRALRDTTDITSTTTTAYTPGNLAAGKTFYIKCTFIDSNGVPTSVKDSVLINVISN